MEETGAGKGRRRLCAIMFADIEGYTAFMQRDEAAAVRMRQRFQDTIQSEVTSVGGEVVQFYGDGALCVFSSAVEACRASIALQGKLRSGELVPVRVGIHIGDILIDSEGAWGDAVNIAARVQALAPAGSVLVSAKVAGELKNHPSLAIRSMGRFRLKNVADGVEIFGLANPALLVPKPKQLKPVIQSSGARTRDGGTDLVSRARRWRALAAAAALAAVLASLGAWGLYERSRTTWARTVALPRIETLIANGHFNSARELAAQAERHVPEDATLLSLWPRMTGPARLSVEPAHARVQISHVNRPTVASEVRVTQAEVWEDHGSGPISFDRLAFGAYRVRVTADGFHTLEDIYHHPPDPSGRTRRWRASLLPEGTLADGMVRIGARTLRANLHGLPPGFRPVRRSIGGEPAYLLGRFEVTNREYKSFVDAGGYQDRRFWKNPFVRDADTLSWNDAMEAFRDRSGRPGPSTWEGGTYPDGQAEYPVSGVSWYEAAAFAVFAGASLPTLYHWQEAGEYRGFDMAGFGNFRGEGPAPVGAAPFGPFGIYDLAGNVREWVWNETSGQRFIMGGSWTDPLYLYLQGAYAPPFNRSEKNGIRLAQFEDGTEEKLEPFHAPIERELPDAPWAAEPVDEDVFQILARGYEYDPVDLESQIDSVDDRSRYWRMERASFDAASGGERMFGYLFLPKNTEPPYQTLVYFPGAGSMRSGSSQRLNAANMIDHVVKTGRAVFHPIYMDTYDRYVGVGQNRGPTREYANRKARWIREARRSIDYLETRADIDAETIGYWGLSWGAEHGPIVMATEPRLRAAVLMDGGAVMVPVPPEADESIFAPQVYQPVLMINGVYDHIFPVESTQRPFFDLLGTPTDQKEHLLYDSGHVVVNTHFESAIDAMTEWLNGHWGVP